MFARQELAETKHLLSEAENALKDSKLTLLNKTKDERIRELETSLLNFVERFLKGDNSTPEHKEPEVYKKKSTNRSKIKLVLYFVYCKEAEAVKIGYTTDIRSRKSSLQVVLLGYIPIPDKSKSLMLYG